MDGPMWVFGYGSLTIFGLFLVFLFPFGTSSGMWFGLFMLGPPIAVIIAVAVILGHWIKPGLDDN